MSDLNPYFNTSNAQMIPTVSGMEAIKQSLTRLLFTPKRHNPFNRDYGCDLYDLLFKSEGFVLHDIRMFLYMRITDYEPRISISASDINITKKDRNTYEVSCVFTVPGLGTSEVNTTITK